TRSIYQFREINECQNLREKFPVLQQCMLGPKQTYEYNKDSDYSIQLLKLKLSRSLDYGDVRRQGWIPNASIIEKYESLYTHVNSRIFAIQATEPVTTITTAVGEGSNRGIDHSKSARRPFGRSTGNNTDFSDNESSDDQF